LTENNFENNENEITVNNGESGRKFSRSNSDFIFSGLCGGLGEYHSTDPVWIRTILLFSVFFMPWFVVVYVVASFILPKSKRIISEEKSYGIRKANSKYFWGVILLFISIYFFLDSNSLLNKRNLFYLPDELVFSLIFIYAGFYNLLWASEYSNKSTPENIFVRSLSNKKFFGVCSGLSRYLTVDVLIIRMIFILLAVITFGLIIIAYFYIAMKTKGEREIIL